MRRNVDLLAVFILLVMIVAASEVRKAGDMLQARSLVVEFAARHAKPFTSVFELPKLCVTRD